MVGKIDKSIDEFKYNVAIAHFYEAYKILNNFLNLKVSNDNLTKNLIKIMKLMLPFTPHLANECLEILKCKSPNEWPDIKKNIEQEVNFAIQVNGKTRDIIKINKDLDEKRIKSIVLDVSKAKKFIKDKTIIKTIFIKNKIINYIIRN